MSSSDVVAAGSLLVIVKWCRKTMANYVCSSPKDIFSFSLKDTEYIALTKKSFSVPWWRWRNNFRAQLASIKPSTNRTKTTKRLLIYTFLFAPNASSMTFLLALIYVGFVSCKISWSGFFLERDIDSWMHLSYSAISSKLAKSIAQLSWTEAKKVINSIMTTSSSSSFDSCPLSRSRSSPLSMSGSFLLEEIWSIIFT